MGRTGRLGSRCVRAQREREERGCRSRPWGWQSWLASVVLSTHRWWCRLWQRFPGCCPLPSLPDPSAPVRWGSRAWLCRALAHPRGWAVAVSSSPAHSSPLLALSLRTLLRAVGLLWGAEPLASGASEGAGKCGVCRSLCDSPLLPRTGEGRRELPSRVTDSPPGPALPGAAATALSSSRLQLRAKERAPCSLGEPFGG